VKQVSGKEFIRLIQKRGWILMRITAVIMFSPGKASRSALSFRFTAIVR